MSAPDSQSSSAPALASRRLALFVILVAAAVLCYLGWRLFWFLTDDAFIVFRYVSNSILGHGYVWNPPPFRPVEGYSCFLWVVLLDLAWRVTGIAPPQAANALSLLFALGTLMLGAAMVMRLRLSAELGRYRLFFLGFVLLGITTNRTFLAWSSSGLETALFNLLLIGWIYLSVFVEQPSVRRDTGIAALAAALSLTRPDGLLFAAASVLIIALRERGMAGGARSSLRRLVPYLPLIAIPIHLIWRRSVYGEWLPNTYYAKYTAPWPASGVRYATSFILEYAVWVWLALAIVVVLPRLRRLWAERMRMARNTAIGGLVVAAVLAHLAYYTFIIGGDHFEYRVYSHLTVLLPVTLVWLLEARRLRFRRAAMLMIAAFLLALPVPWTHWGLTHKLATREATINMRVPIAPAWPAPARFYARGFDSLQNWLIEHMVCTRHQEHKVFWLQAVSLYPPREEGGQISGEGYPVYINFAIGMPGWTLPHVNVIDLWGLNDYVIARSRITTGGTRFIAHERIAPKGYLECLRPNVSLEEGAKVTVHPRRQPLTAEEIRACERTWAERVRHARAG